MGNDSFYISAPVTFHEYHGRNIILSENDTVAYRQSGYADGITFSKKPLKPGEIFLLEIEMFEHGWIGNLRFGLTQQNPSTNFALPQYALPDLIDGGQSWIIPISTADINTYGRSNFNKLYPDIHEDNNFVHNSKGSMPISILQPQCHKSCKKTRIEDPPFFTEPPVYDENRLYNDPTDVGSRIGVTYIVRDNYAEMYMLLNGDVYGPCATGIPYRKGPIYAVIDLYGTTKQVRIVQTFGIPSLKMACRETILQQVPHSKIYCLPLPKRMIQYLTYRT